MSTQVMTVLSLLLGSTSALAQTTEPRAAIAHPAPTNLVVDGDLADWRPGIGASSPPLDLHPAVSHHQGDARPISARVWLAFNDDALLLAARIIDADVKAAHRGEHIWKDDLLELSLVDAKEQLYHLGLSPTGEVHLFGRDRKRLPQAAAQREQAGWLVEARIPWAHLGHTKPPSNALRLNLALKDQGPPVQHLVWSGVHPTQPASLGWLHLSNAPPPQVSSSTCLLTGPTTPVYTPITATGGQLKAGDAPLTLRLVNFQGAQRSWVRFWEDFDITEVQRDLDRVVSLGANGIRVFVFFEAFGHKQPTAHRIRQLHQVVDAAARRGLLSVVTFFPFKKDLSGERRPEMLAHVTAIASAFRGVPGLAMWDLMNELDHAWALPDARFTRAQADAWVPVMLHALRTADPTHLVTVGLAGHTAHRGLPLQDDPTYRDVDVISVHAYFEPLSAVSDMLGRIRSSFPRKPVVLQELGISSIIANPEEGRTYYQSICDQAARHALAGVGAWELYDHPVGSIAHLSPRWQDTPENHFGLLHADGSAKPSAEAFCKCLTPTRLQITSGGSR